MAGRLCVWGGIVWSPVRKGKKEKAESFGFWCGDRKGGREKGES